MLWNGRKDIRAYLLFEAVIFAAIKVAELAAFPTQTTKCIMYSAIVGNTVMALWLRARYGNAAEQRDHLIFYALMVNCVADIFLTLTGGERMMIPGFALFCTLEALYAAYLRPDARNLTVRAAAFAAAILFAKPMGLLTLPNALGLLNLTLVGGNAVCAWLARRRDSAFPALLFALGLTCFLIGDISVALEIMLPVGTAAQRIAALAVWTFYVPAQVLIVLTYSEKLSA